MIGLKKKVVKIMGIDNITGDDPKPGRCLKGRQEQGDTESHLGTLQEQLLRAESTSLRQRGPEAKENKIYT